MWSKQVSAKQILQTSQTISSKSLASAKMGQEGFCLRLLWWKWKTGCGLNSKAFVFLTSPSSNTHTGHIPTMGQTCPFPSFLHLYIFLHNPGQHKAQRAEWFSWSHKAQEERQDRSKKQILTLNSQFCSSNHIRASHRERHETREGSEVMTMFFILMSWRRYRYMHLLKSKMCALKKCMVHYI